ncbi:hypothetical protein [Bradyrhizobium sp. URHC0002]
MDDATLLLPERRRWESVELEAEVRGILDAIEAPPAHAEVITKFQKILYWARLFNEDGRGQIVLASRCILESEGNQDAFRQPFVSAVLSSVGEFADRGLELVEAFDQINLVGILEQMRALELFYLSDVPSALCQIVRNKLGRILSPPQPEPVKAPSTLERRAADKQATAEANRRIVERNIALGRRLAELRDTMPSNRKFGAAVRKLGHDNPLEVAEMARVARRYGDRTEIYSKVGWRVLKEMASTATSETQRRKFEDRIIAGERVTGAEIIRARSHSADCFKKK